MIDHAVLKPTQTERDVVDACTLARHEHIASVCVKPFYVPVTARLLKDSGVETSTVIGFPHGGQSPEVKVATATNALHEGATVEDVRLLRQVGGPGMGVKAAGGIRTLDDALAMIGAGASRLGTSATATILAELRHRRGEE